MRPRLLLLRRALAPSPHPTTLRTFAQSTAVRYGARARPQLPFLSVPTSTRAAQRVRYLTTERKAQLKYEIKQGIKYTSYIWIVVACFAACSIAISQEMLERQYPSPHEWSYLTRMRFRGAHCERDQTDPARPTDWLAVMQWIQGAIERLENPKVDGKGLKDAPSDHPPRTKDLRDMPEAWRRGYFEAMMLYAKAAEHLDGWMLDRTRKMVFPADMVVGPSNPKPRPIPAGVQGAPKEEDCEVAYEPADDIYLRLLNTEGLTSRQQMDARLAFASWLEFKGITGPASIVYEEALELAISQRPDLSAEPVDRKTLTLNDAAGLPSANLLTALTAYSTFRARNGDLSSSLPIFVSLLKARRSLPNSEFTVYEPPPPPEDEPTAENITIQLGKKLLAKIMEPPYPPPPPDGSSPPFRDAKSICEEAALSLHIGEILYASNPGSREEGLGWTRDAVDVAEEQLHRLNLSATHKPARTTCRDCLATGLQNWSAMVARLAKEEAARKEAQPKKQSWFGIGLWGHGKEEEDLTRWAAEERVIEERTKRSQGLLEELEPPAWGIASFFRA
ncbi:hypothetical protein QBC47DRAFT_375572 [Echria macrotheca]|uniref:MFS maltose permease n=1 Tax=Echria macrotheca TaxID=438768 RepID=A0AAJ0BI49_9PEZI|nr:hypothetical protein QBC47DRAFT_375572 [Echria macrotheca]